ncbi:MAG: tetratricopeptide repeat protein [Anaerolineales bacterium]|nr:tetratricopeptide repeat protein [Anaerolineales bacterium]
MKSSPSHLPVAPLTDREREILRLLAQGLSDREIAEETILTVGTIKWYNRQIYSKLGVRNRTQATARAEEWGLLRRSTDSAQTTPLEIIKHNLPAQLTSFIGRKAETAQLRILLGESRLVTLTGPPGTGKTRLALEVASVMLPYYRDGVFWVPLAPVNDPRLVLNSIAQHVGEMTESSGKSLLETVQDKLRDKSLLLILDNFEHLLSAAPLVSELLLAAPHLTVFVTSREALRLYGEHEFPVDPLQLPERDHARSPEDLQAYEAIDLFVQRARAVEPDFALDNANAASVVAICAHLDGLPLAVELAAARIRYYAPQNLLIRLSSRLEALSGGPRDLPARQRTLRATLAWSYDLLDDGEKRLFARLGIFVNGCSRAAAQAICSQDLEIDLLIGLESLLAKSLLQKEQMGTGDARLVMLETMREYALEKLTENGELDAIRALHARYFITLLESAANEFYGPNEPDWLAKFEAEHDNLRAALQWTLSADDTAQMSLSLIAHLARFWELKGYFSEARNWLAEAFRLPGAAQPTKARADALYGVGQNAYYQCDYVASQALFEEALNIYQNLDDQRAVANTLISIGEVATEIGDYNRAPMLFERAYDIVHQMDDVSGNAWALTQLGFGALRVGNLSQAQQWLEEGLALYRRADDTVGEALALSGLGEIAVRKDELEQATDFLEHSLTLRQGIGQKWGIAATLGSLAWAALRQGKFARATQILNESLHIRMEIDDRGGIAWCLEKLAEVAQQRGETGQAVRLYGAAAAIRARINSVIDPVDEAAYAERIKHLQDGLPPDIYEAVWAEGQTMTMEQIRDILD